MSKYYCLIAGLPHITPDDTKLTYSVADFKMELEPVLSAADQKLMRWFFLKFDNRNILLYVRKNVGVSFDEKGNFSQDDIASLCDSLKNEGRAPEKMPVPAYLTSFLQAYYARLQAEESIDFNLLEDNLSTLYFEAAMSCGNAFLSSWFEMNLNMGNILTSLNCRKYGLNKEQYIIGNNEIAEQLRASGARDLNFGNEIDYLAELSQIVEEKDPMTREKRLDLLRWKWLDTQTFFKTFDIEAVLSYILRLEMLERWMMMDKLRGETAFRQLVSDMKLESAATLEEFKEKNK